MLGKLIEDDVLTGCDSLCAERVLCKLCEVLEEKRVG